MDAASTSLTANPTGLIAFSLVAGLVLTPILSALLLWRYRTAVARSMNRMSGGPPALPKGPPPLSGAHGAMPELEIKTFDAADSVAGDLDPAAATIARRIKTKRRGLASIYLFAGAAQAVTMLIFVFVFEGLEFFPRRVVAVLATFLWPAAFAINSTTVASRRWKLLAPLLLFLVSQIAGIGFNKQVTTLWAVAMLPPTAFWFIFANRKLKAVGPFLMLLVFAFMVATNIGLSIGFPPAYATKQFWPLVVAVMLAALAGVAAAVVIWVLMARGYRRKRTSDQALMMDALFLFFTFWETLSLLMPATASHSNPWLGLVGLTAVIPYKLVARLGWKIARRRAEPHEPLPLLLLRTFGFRGRSERLAEEVGEQWRSVGSVQLIGGPDLASANLEPHEFLGFISGRLSREFVKDEADLESRLGSMDRRPDPDGRFRVNEFFCHADRWQSAVTRLAENSSAVLMDLRGFSPQKQGCVFEIHELLRRVALERVRFLTDDSTDEAFLHRTFREAWQTGGAVASAEGAAPSVRLLRVRGRSAAEIRQIVRELASAAAAPVHSPARS